MTVAVRTDLTAAEVREQARAAAAPDQARRLLAIALVLEGASREDAARSTGMAGAACSRPLVDAGYSLRVRAAFGTSPVALARLATDTKRPSC